VDWRERFAAKQTTLARAIGRIPKGKRIFLGSGAAEPIGLMEELVAQASRFADNPILHILTMGPAPYTEPRYQDAFRHHAFFIGGNVREAVHEGRADYVPVFLSRIPELIRRRRLPVDVALVQVSPPDRFGFVNLGVSVDIVLAALESAPLVIAEVNPEMPTVFGEGWVSMDRIHAWVERAAPLPTLERDPIDDVACSIGRHVASLVEDGCTLQVGIGQIPDAVLGELRDRSDLGVWTELLTDGLVELIRSGNVTGRFKTMDPRVASSSFAMGSAETYAWLDRNPAVAFHPSDVINDPMNVARQHKMVAINAALQIDLTGQVCSDSLGTKFYSGIGGQVDFIRGASMGKDGKPIIAVRSTAKNGELSRIVSVLDEGAGVVTSRGDVRYVVTEYGVADLLGRSIRQRALALISIAHPDHRAELLTQAKRRHYVFADQIEPRSSYARAHEERISSPRGDLLLRPIRETDEDRVQELFYSLSPETVYKRWLTVTPAMHHRDLMRYLDVDDVDHVALVAETQPHDTEPELIGVARYNADAITRQADVAIVIRDDWQNNGVGTAMLEQLVEIAEQNGVVGITGSVLATNASMLHVFRKVRGGTEMTREGSLCTIEMPLSPRK
jgi:acyl-CoA hydrolase/RimJ/RimL family protein N-acetyltransferase